MASSIVASSGRGLQRLDRSLLDRFARHGSNLPLFTGSAFVPYAVRLFTVAVARPGSFNVSRSWRHGDGAYRPSRGRRVPGWRDALAVDHTAAPALNVQARQRGLPSESG
jgi:hypothetical protein